MTMDHSIRTFGEPVLRQKAKPVAKITPEITALITEMKTTMLEAPGIGLAAPQVGESIRLVIVTFGLDSGQPHPRALINPEILWHSDRKETMEEGCLSLPGLTGDVARWLDIKVRAMDEDGLVGEFEAHGITARIIQHETDHLDGILFVDRIDLIRQESVKRRLGKQIRKEHSLV